MHATPQDEPTRLTIPDVVERFADYCQLPGNGAWGSLHCVLADGNVSDDDVRGAIERAKEKGDDEGAALGEILLGMSKTQRLKLPHAVHEDIRLAAMGNYCVRVYPDGEAKDTIRDRKGMRGWLEYNRKARGGNALFVNGKLAGPKDNGYLSEEQVAYVEGMLTKEIEQGLHDLSKPEQMAQQTERFGGLVDRWFGYRPEPNRSRFKLPQRRSAASKV